MHFVLVSKPPIFTWQKLIFSFLRVDLKVSGIFTVIFKRSDFLVKDLIKKMGHKKLNIELQEKITEIPKDLAKYNLEIDDEHMSLIYTYNVGTEKTGITNLLQDLKDTGLKLRDLKTEQSNLEKIFVNLVKENNEI